MKFEGSKANSQSQGSSAEEILTNTELLNKVAKEWNVSPEKASEILLKSHENRLIDNAEKEKRRQEADAMLKQIEVLDPIIEIQEGLQEHFTTVDINSLPTSLDEADDLEIKAFRLLESVENSSDQKHKRSIEKEAQQSLRAGLMAKALITINLAVASGQESKLIARSEAEKLWREAGNRNLPRPFSQVYRSVGNYVWYLYSLEEPDRETFEEIARLGDANIRDIETQEKLKLLYRVGRAFYLRGDRNIEEVVSHYNVPELKDFADELSAMYREIARGTSRSGPALNATGSAEVFDANKQWAGGFCGGEKSARRPRRNNDELEGW